MIDLIIGWLIGVSSATYVASRPRRVVNRTLTREERRDRKRKQYCRAHHNRSLV